MANGVICCIFTKSSSDFTAHFDITPHLWPNSDPPPHRLISLLLFKLCLFLFVYLFVLQLFPVNSILFIIWTPPVSLWSFFVPCMWISFACDSLVPDYFLPFPFLTIACDYSLSILLLFSVVMTTLYMSNSVYIVKVMYLVHHLVINVNVNIELDIESSCPISSLYLHWSQDSILCSTISDSDLTIIGSLLLLSLSLLFLHPVNLPMNSDFPFQVQLPINSKTPV